MFTLYPSYTDQWTLQQFIKQVRQHPDVTGVVVSGSGANDTLKPYSDYDVILFLKDDSLIPHVMLTSIDHRLTDVIFIRHSLLNELLNISSMRGDTEEEVTKNWIQNGIIYHDPTGILTKLAKKTIEQHGTTDHRKYDVWFRTNFDLLHTQRMLEADDDIYLIAADSRLMYMIAQVWVGYFTVRDIAWRGDKFAIRYTRDNDPQALQLYQATLYAPDRHTRFHAYRTLAEYVLEPVGGLWHSQHVTAFNLRDANMSPDEWQPLYQQLWQSLIGIHPDVD